MSHLNPSLLGEFLLCYQILFCSCLPGGSVSKESACNAGDLGLIPGLGRSPGGGQGNPFQSSYLENPHGQRSLTSCSPCVRKELEATEWLSTVYRKWKCWLCPTLCDPMDYTVHWTIMNTSENVCKDEVLQIDVGLILSLFRTSMKDWKYLRILLEVVGVFFVFVFVFGCSGSLLLHMDFLWLWRVGATF